MLSCLTCVAYIFFIHSVLIKGLTHQRFKIDAPGDWKLEGKQTLRTACRFMYVSESKRTKQRHSCTVAHYWLWVPWSLSFLGFWRASRRTEINKKKIPIPFMTVFRLATALIRPLTIANTHQHTIIWIKLNQTGLFISLYFGTRNTHQHTWPTNTCFRAIATCTNTNVYTFPRTDTCT